MKKDIFKVGDKVVITKGNRNWVTEMNQYIGQVRIIESIDFDCRPDTVVKFEDDLEESEHNYTINSWSWVYEHGHFEPYEKKKLKIKLKF